MSIDSQAQAFLDYAAQAEQGDAEAQYQTGICYAQGKGVERSYRNAAHYWLKAAKQQHSEAQMYLGTLFEKGLDVPQDYVKAAQCYHTAAQQGSASAKVRLAMLYYQGLGVVQDINEAINLFIQAAEQGDAAAQYNLGAAYEKGLGRLTQNQQQAQFWYQQAANQNYAQAIKALSQSPHQDTIAQSDLAATPMRATEALVDSQALFEQGLQALDVNLSEAIDNFAKAAEQGHARAQYNLGLAYLFGLGGQARSQAQAEQWLQQSAEQDFRAAHVVLAWLHQGGMAVMQNLTTATPVSSDPDNAAAIQHYEKAADLGHAQAQYFLAKIYEMGNGTQKDAQKSLTWLRQAAKQGYGSAYQELERLIP